MDIYNNLRKSGWFEGRKIDKEDITDCFIKNGFPLIESAIYFLEEFGNLLILFLNKKNGIKNDTIDLNFKKAMGIEVIERVEDYSQRINKKLCIIGTAYREHLILLMAEDGNVYGAFDDFLCYISNSGIQAIEAIIEGYHFNEIQ